MSHGEAVILLTDYVDGRLSEQLGNQVRAHLGSCSECAGLVETIQAVATAPRGSGSEGGLRAGATDPEAHPSSVELVEYALARMQADHARGTRALPVRGMEVAAHVRGCAECSDSVRVVTESEAELSGNTPFAHRRPQAVPRLALAAAAIAAAGLSYLGLYRLPVLQKRVDQLESDRAQEQARTPQPALSEQPPVTESQPTSSNREMQGALRIQELPQVRRSGGSLPELTIIPGEPTLYLSIDSPLLLQEGLLWRFSIVGPAGVDAWSWDVPADELRRLTRSSEIVLAVPSGKLSAGHNTLHLQRAGMKSPSLIEVPFVLKMVSSAPEVSK
jgi:anti-sigma factor RsiW